MRRPKYLQPMMGVALALFLIGCNMTTSMAETPVSTRTSPPLTPSLMLPTLTPFTPTPIPPAMVLPERNYSPILELQPKQSQELIDNYIGTDLGSYDPGYNNPDIVYPIGFKWIRISFSKDVLNWQRVESEPSKYTIDVNADEKITEYAQNGIKIILNLGVGDGENRLDVTRFRSQEDITRYINFVRFMVHYFKDRIQYYEIWNEPGDIAVQDYANLVKQVVPVIREEYPEAKIVIGAVPGNWENGYPGYGQSGRFSLDVNYLRNLLKSGVAPLADAVSWHPFYGNRADDPYYQDYPQMVRSIQELAVSQGFHGEFITEESVWRTASDQLDPMVQRVTEQVATKYFLRAIVMQRGLGIIVTIALPGAHDSTLPKVQAIHNLCDILAGAIPVNMPIYIQNNTSTLDSYTFSLPNGDVLIALWADEIPVDVNTGVNSALIIPGFSAQQVMVIDVVHGDQQQATVTWDGTNLVISNLLVKDYPIILRLTK